MGQMMATEDRSPEERATVSDPKIVDVIAKKSPYSDQIHYYVVVDQPVSYVYAPSPVAADTRDLFVHPGQTYFLGRCGDFRDYLAGTARKGKAFGSREFDIDLADGSKFHCKGDVWSCGRRKSDPQTVQVGVATLAELTKCYVFSGGNVLRETLEAWLSVNTPTDDYYKHDERTQWNRYVRPTLRVVLSQKRRRKLQRRGESVWFEPRLRAWVWKMEKAA